jgi:hypothetical protein
MLINREILRRVSPLSEMSNVYVKDLLFYSLFIMRREAQFGLLNTVDLNH